MANVEVNGRRYRLPERPTVVVCFDGCDPEYIRRGLADGILPTIAGLRETGFVGEALAAVPTFTNPNNASIVTGVPPAVHGISGNYYLDRATGEERMITDAAMLRCGTILAAVAGAGVATAAVTAKDKLRLMLARGLEGIAFSSEKADRATLADNGIADVEAMVGRAKPDQYSADLSLFVLDAGIRLLGARGGEAALPVPVGLRAARPCARHAGSRCLQQGGGCAYRAADGAGGHRRRRGRPRHERQVPARRHAQRGVPGGGAGASASARAPCG